MAEVTLVLTEAAQRNIVHVDQRLAAIREKYGETSPEYVKSLESWDRALSSMLRLGGRVFAEDELSFVTTSFITYGTIGHSIYKDGERDPLLVEWSIHS